MDYINFSLAICFYVGQATGLWAPTPHKPDQNKAGTKKQWDWRSLSLSSSVDKYINSTTVKLSIAHRWWIVKTVWILKGYFIKGEHAAIEILNNFCEKNTNNNFYGWLYLFCWGRKPQQISTSQKLIWTLNLTKDSLWDCKARSTEAKSTSSSLKITFKEANLSQYSSKNSLNKNKKESMGTHVTLKVAFQHFYIHSLARFN